MISCSLLKATPEAVKSKIAAGPPAPLELFREFGTILID
jgi:hypothetical protein